MSPALSTPDAATLTIAAAAVPTISPGTCLRLRREALGLSLEDLALLLGTSPTVPVIRRVEWLASIEADVAPISLPTAIALHDVIAIDLRVLSYWMEVAAGSTPSLADVMFTAGIDLASGPDLTA